MAFYRQKNSNKNDKLCVVSKKINFKLFTDFKYLKPSNKVSTQIQLPSLTNNHNNLLTKITGRKK